jgi:hypothetical protein
MKVFSSVGFSILLMVASLGHTQAQAQAFRPYKDSQILLSQWQSYYDAVSSKFAETLRDLDKDHLQLYFDSVTGITYTFTKPSHPAHPAWVSRIIVVVDGKYAANQAGFYAGSQHEYNLLYATIAEINERLRKGLSSAQ